MAYKIVLGEDVPHMLRDFPGDFKKALRAQIPSLDAAAGQTSLGGNPGRFQVALSANGIEWEVVSLLEEKQNRIVVLGAYPKAPEHRTVSREDALAIVQAGIGPVGKGHPVLSTSRVSGTFGRVSCLVTDAILDTTFFIDLRFGDAGAERLWESVQDGSLYAAFPLSLPLSCGLR